jgi:hypothetical protein
LATDADKLSTENWGLNMEICDYVNVTENGGRDAIRAIRKRLQNHMGKNNGIVMYTLTVLETCVKNGDQRFKALVCQKEFINELVRLISAKFDAPQIVQERVLMLIQVSYLSQTLLILYILQQWSDAFRKNLFIILGLPISFETGFKKCRILERTHSILHHVVHSFLAHLLVYNLCLVALVWIFKKWAFEFGILSTIFNWDVMHNKLCQEYWSFKGSIMFIMRTKIRKNSLYIISQVEMPIF